MFFKVIQYENLAVQVISFSNNNNSNNNNNNNNNNLSLPLSQRFEKKISKISSIAGHTLKSGSEPGSSEKVDHGLLKKRALHQILQLDKFEGANFKYNNSIFKFMHKNT